MKATDIVAFCFGSRGAIERVAGCRWALLVGAVLVLSAGIARNWDAVELTRDARWVLGPFGMSLFSATFLFLVAVLRLGVGAVGRWETQFVVFVRLFWMTAPCAWLYAIPVEQWTDPLRAAQWNVGFLVVVSLWRVALMVRALSVLTEVPFLRVLVVLLPAAAFEMFAAGFLKAFLNIAMTMGGVRDLLPEDVFVTNATAVIMGVSLVTFLVVGLVGWFVGTDRVARRPLFRDPTPFPRAALAVAVAVVALAALGSAPMQRRVANQARFQRLIQANRIEEAARYAAAHGPGDFPASRLRPDWPRTYRDSAFEDSVALLEALPPDAPAWLRDDWENMLISMLRNAQWGVEAMVVRVGHRHPRIDGWLRARADDLRSRKRSLPENELRWLQDYAAAQKTLRTESEKAIVQ